MGFHTRAVELGAPVRRLVIGHTLPRGSTVASAQLDGRPVPYRARETTAASR